MAMKAALHALLVILMATSFPVRAKEFDLLSADQAFKVTMARATNGDLLVSFSAQDGYALYREKIKINTKPRQVIRVIKPAGEIHVDEFLGPQSLYRGTKVVRVVLPAADRVLQLEIQSQGCADVGVCYNPRIDVLQVPR